MKQVLNSWNNSTFCLKCQMLFAHLLGWHAPATVPGFILFPLHNWESLPRSGFKPSTPQLLMKHWPTIAQTWGCITQISLSSIEEISLKTHKNLVSCRTRFAHFKQHLFSWPKYWPFEKCSVLALTGGNSARMPGQDKQVESYRQKFCEKSFFSNLTQDLFCWS